MNTQHPLRSAPEMIGLCLIAALLASCSTLNGSVGPRAVAMVAPTSAAAPASMNPQGTVLFVQRGNTVHISGRLTGLRPGAEHGFHVHEAADCSADGMGTKGHFNPDGAPHGSHGSQAHHAGDLPSLKADANGVAEFNFTSPRLTVTTGPTSVVGRGLIVHRDPDDYKTQPTGNAGPRPGCAVIRAG